MRDKELILASASPRRLALLADIGIVPDRVLPAEIEEVQAKGELPRELARRLAIEKADAIAASERQALILAADTVVAMGRRVLPKAETDEEVRTCLRKLSGRRHRVFTGVALLGPNGLRQIKLCESVVVFKRMEALEIEAYVASQEGIGKAGGYAIQGRAAAYIRALSGSYSNVVGLPLYEVAQMLQRAGRTL